MLVCCRVSCWCAAGSHAGVLQGLMLVCCRVSCWCAAGSHASVLQGLMLVCCRVSCWCAAGSCLSCQCAVELYGEVMFQGSDQMIAPPLT